MNINDLIFDPMAHQYFHKDTNVFIPSVSYLLNGKVTIETDAMRRGTLIHNCTQAIIQGTDVSNYEEDIISVSRELVKTMLSVGVKSSKKIEYVVLGDIQGCLYAGRFDFLGEDANGNPFLLDIKTGTSVSDKHFSQLWAYYHGLRTMGEIDAVAKAVVVHEYGLARSMNITEGYMDTDFTEKLLAYYGQLEGKYWQESDGTVKNTIPDIDTPVYKAFERLERGLSYKRFNVPKKDSAYKMPSTIPEISGVGRELALLNYPNLFTTFTRHASITAKYNGDVEHEIKDATKADMEAIDECKMAIDEYYKSTKFNATFQKAIIYKTLGGVTHRFKKGAKEELYHTYPQWFKGA